MKPVYNSIQTIYGGGGIDLQFKGFLATRGETYEILDEHGALIIGNLRIDFPMFGRNTTSNNQLAQFPLFCSDGRMIGVADGKPGMFTRDGRPISPSSGVLWRPLSCDAPYAVKVGEKFGYIDAALRPLIEAKFELVGLFHDKFAVAKLDGNNGSIRTDGTWAIEPNFDIAEVLQNQKALVKAGGRSAIVDVTTGSLVTSTQFDDVSCPLGRDIVGVMLDGRRAPSVRWANGCSRQNTNHLG